MPEAKMFSMIVLARVWVLAEDAGHAADVIRDTMDDERFANAKILYCRPKEEANDAS